METSKHRDMKKNPGKIKFSKFKKPEKSELRLATQP